MRRRPIKRGAARKAARQRLGLRISMGLDALLELPEGALTGKEQTILRRIQDIHLGKISGTLTEVDYKNMKTIAAKHKTRFY